MEEGQDLVVESVAMLVDDLGEEVHADETAFGSRNRSSVGGGYGDVVEVRRACDGCTHLAVHPTPRHGVRPRLYRLPVLEVVQLAYLGISSYQARAIPRTVADLQVLRVTVQL